jgi:hypothetical protein
MADIYVATTGNDTTGDGSSGNPYATPGKAAGVASAGDTIWIKSGTYTIGSGAANTAGNKISVSANAINLRGYTVTIGDYSTKPILQAGAITSDTILTHSGNFALVSNLRVDGNSASAVAGVNISGAVSFCHLLDVINCPAGGAVASDSRSSFSFCYASGNATYGLRQSSGNMFGCVATANTATGLQTGAGAFVNCISYGNTGGSSHGFNSSGGDSYDAYGCTAYNNGGSGFDGSGNGFNAVNCIAYGNAAYGFSTAGSPLIQVLSACAGGSNTSGNYNSANPRLVRGFVALSGDPFTNAAGGVFSLNNTAGAGADLRAVAYPTSFPDGLTANYLDIGAAQHEDAGGGGGLLTGNLTANMQS